MNDLVLYLRFTIHHSPVFLPTRRAIVASTTAAATAVTTTTATAAAVTTVTPTTAATATAIAAIFARSGFVDRQVAAV